MKCTSVTKLDTIRIAPMMPAMMTCAGLSDTAPFSYSARRADAEERPKLRLDHLRRRCACRLPFRHFHQLAFLAVPSISKNAYDNVIVLTSSGNPCSMTNTTGICLASPGCSVCCVKQKHSSFLK